MAAKSILPPTIPQTGKHIQFNREDRDYSFFYNGQYLGSRADRQDAVNCLNEYVYDLERGYIAVADVQLIPSIAEQIALIGPGDMDCESILNVDLPTGENVERHVSDDGPADWITVTRGEAERIVEVGEDDVVYLCGRNISGVTLQDADDLRALLSMDRGYLESIADLGPDVSEACEVWLSLPYDEHARLAETVGFAAWYADPNRQRVPCPEEEKPAPVVAPTPAYTPDPIAEGIGYMLAGLTYLIRDELDDDRASCLLDLLTRIGEKAARKSAATIALVDRLLMASADVMEDERYILQAAIAPDTTPPPVVEVSYLYRKPNGDTTHEPIGPVAWTDYVCGTGNTRALVSLDTAGVEPAEVILMQEGIDTPIERHLADMEAAIANMRRVLADPRVQSGRVRREAVMPLKKAA